MERRDIVEFPKSEFVSNINMKFAIVWVCILAVTCAQIQLSSEEQQQLLNDQRCSIPCRCGELKNLSHPYDCTKYTICKNGVLTVKDCPNGYKFSTDTKTCLHSAGGAGQGCLACWQRRPLDY